MTVIESAGENENCFRCAFNLFCCRKAYRLHGSINKIKAQFYNLQMFHKRLTKARVPAGT